MSTSRTVRSRSRLRVWGTTAIRRFTSCGASDTETPSTAIRPELGRTSVLMQPSVVLLPAPFGPSRPKNSPRSTLNDTPRTASTGAVLRVAG